ncbi:MAG: hypothetical protein HY077_05350 [Elusimicrobia bacterium]|nr:hypothetical protein [Elusimicrobiota bacterium]
MKGLRKSIAVILAAALTAMAPDFASYAAAADALAGGEAAVKPVILPKIEVAKGANLGTQTLTAVPGAETGINLALPSGVEAGARDASLNKAPAQPGALPAPLSQTLASPQAGQAVSPGAPEASPVKLTNGAETSRDGPAAAVSPASQAQTAAAETAGSGPANGASPSGSTAFDGSVKGRSLLLVGTSGSRPFILEQTKKIADKLGLTLYLVDKPEARAASKDLVPDANFIAAPIDKHDEGAMASVVKAVSDFAKTAKIDAVHTFLNPYAELAGQLVDALGSRGNPGAFLKAAHTKSLARELLAKEDPEIATASRVVTSVEESRAAYNDFGGGKFVMKPIHGGGSMMVVVGLDSEEAVAKVYAEIDDGIKEIMTRSDAGFFMLDKHPGIMIERQLEGPEVDVELVIQDGKVKFWHVSDNPPMDKPYAVEKATTYPSQLPKWVQEALADAAGRAVFAVARGAGIPAGQIVGNMHVEMMMTKDGPRLLEINARMGGAEVFNWMLSATGFNLIEQGVRSVMGLPVEENQGIKTTVEGRFGIPKASGMILKIEGMDIALRIAGVDFIREHKKDGQTVLAAPDSMFDYIFTLSASGKDYNAAMNRALAAMRAIKITIMKPDGTIVVQDGTYTHEKVDMTALLDPSLRGEAPKTPRSFKKLPEVSVQDIDELYGAKVKAQERARKVAKSAKLVSVALNTAGEDGKWIFTFQSKSRKITVYEKRIVSERLKASEKASTIWNTRFLNAFSLKAAYTQLKREKHWFKPVRAELQGTWKTDPYWLFIDNEGRDVKIDAVEGTKSEAPVKAAVGERAPPSAATPDSPTRPGADANIPAVEEKAQAAPAVETPAPEAAKAAKKSVFAQLKEAFKNLPGSFKAFMAGSSLLAMAQEGTSIVFSIYGITQFGIVTGVLSQAANLVARIPGSLFGAKFVKKFDAKKIYMATTLIQGLLLLSLPLGAWFFGIASIPFLVQYFAVQVVQGLFYGATRGMAESQIMPRLVGQDKKTLETAGFLWMASVEAFALTTAFVLSPGIRHLLGSNWALGIFAAIMLSSLAFFKKIKFVDQVKTEEKKAEPVAAEKGEDKLPWREYIPYVATSFLHFAFYGLFSGLFAMHTFHNEFMADRATGSYDAGSLVIGLMAAIPALLATLNPVAPKDGEPAKKGFLDRHNLKTWFAVAAVVAALYLGTGFMGWVIPGLIAAALLGSMTTVNRTKWMSSYLSRLKPSKHAKIVAVLNSLSVAASLIPFAVISIAKIMGYAPIQAILAIGIGAAVALAIGWVATRDPKKDQN